MVFCVDNPGAERLACHPLCFTVELRCTTRPCLRAVAAALVLWFWSRRRISSRVPITPRETALRWLKAHEMLPKRCLNVSNCCSCPEDSLGLGMRVPWYTASLIWLEQNNADVSAVKLPWSGKGGCSFVCIVCVTVPSPFIPDLVLSLY